LFDVGFSNNIYMFEQYGSNCSIRVSPV